MDLTLNSIPVTFRSKLGRPPDFRPAPGWHRLRTDLKYIAKVLKMN